MGDHIPLVLKYDSTLDSNILPNCISLGTLLQDMAENHILICFFLRNINATEALIKFIKILLKDYGNIDYESFPSSLYKAKNLVDQFTSFVTYPKCHKLYN